ncbi:PREDICTED: uncharacterized protein LOC108616640 [Drosophila arizonae]|uniref:Uncharacterized protein LOC108616640 n=1 Tax=Drosophila arizonae TaxID=7263 RepID=A0ABM1PJW1_DROAR|nr:PREDICTED: uncharacterized protein LOC108616640 [Drosophila arizonae]
MLKSTINCVNAHRRCLSYFSNAFNNLANQSASSQNVKNLDLDVFVNQDHKQMDLVDKLVKLRKQKHSTSVPLLPNILVKQLLDLSGPHDAVAVLRNPLQYGIFIDQFTGCHLMDLLLHNGSIKEAAQVSALLVERDLCNNELISALALKSFYAYLKIYKPSPPPEKPEKPEVQKVRVKFLRNIPETIEKSEEKLLGESLIKLGLSPSLDQELAKNITLLGLIMSDNYAEAEQFISQNEQSLYKDAVQLGQKLIESLEGRSNPEFKTLLDAALAKCVKADSFDEILDKRVKLSASSFEPQLISEYDKSFKAWQANFQRAVEDQMKVLETNQRIENIESTLSAMEARRQNLWFFENKEDIDIQIFKKKVFYPKRWFGKKKKPKTVDAFYVPPTITRGH